MSLYACCRIMPNSHGPTQRDKTVYGRYLLLFLFFLSLKVRFVYIYACIAVFLCCYRFSVNEDLYKSRFRNCNKSLFDFTVN